MPHKGKKAGKGLSKGGVRTHEVAQVSACLPQVAESASILTGRRAYASSFFPSFRESSRIFSTAAFSRR